MNDDIKLGLWVLAISAGLAISLQVAFDRDKNDPCPGGAAMYQPYLMGDKPGYEFVGCTYDITRKS